MRFLQIPFLATLSVLSQAQPNEGSLFVKFRYVGNNSGLIAMGPNIGNIQDPMEFSMAAAAEVLDRGGIYSTYPDYIGPEGIRFRGPAREIDRVRSEIEGQRSWYRSVEFDTSGVPARMPIRPPAPAPGNEIYAIKVRSVPADSGLTSGRSSDNFNPQTAMENQARIADEISTGARHMSRPAKIVAISPQGLVVEAASADRAAIERIAGDITGNGWRFAVQEFDPVTFALERASPAAPRAVGSAVDPCNGPLIDLIR